MRPVDSRPRDIVIVGGSLAGLTLALACATRGVPVRVIERSAERRQGGDSLSIDLDELFAATGHDPRMEPALPVVPAYSDRVLTTWSALYAWLRDRVGATPGILVEEGRAVASVADLGDRAQLSFEDGTQRVAEAVIGADGYRSVVRRAVAPDAPFARYAGYLVWRGLIDESVLPHPVSRTSDAGLWIEFVGGYRLVAAVLPGRDGSLHIGRRQVTFAWFDAHWELLLRRMGCLTPDGYVVGTLGQGMINEAVRLELAVLAGRVWPDIWVEAVRVGVRSTAVLSGSPIAEYQPDRMVRGVLAIVGDAAHVVSPMTGRGFASGVEDARALARLLSERHSNEPLSAALARFEAARLPLVQSLVARSNSISSQYRRYAATT